MDEEQASVKFSENDLIFKPPVELPARSILKGLISFHPEIYDRHSIADDVGRKVCLLDARIVEDNINKFSQEPEPLVQMVLCYFEDYGIPARIFKMETSSRGFVNRVRGFIPALKDNAVAFTLIRREGKLGFAYYWLEK